MTDIDLNKINIFDYIDDVDSFIDEWFELHEATHNHYVSIADFLKKLEWKDLEFNSKNIHKSAFFTFNQIELNVLHYNCLNINMSFEKYILSRNTTVGEKLSIETDQSNYDLDSKLLAA